MEPPSILLLLLVALFLLSSFYHGLLSSTHAKSLTVTIPHSSSPSEQITEKENDEIHFGTHVTNARFASPLFINDTDLDERGFARWELPPNESSLKDDAMSGRFVWAPVRVRGATKTMLREGKFSLLNGANFEFVEIKPSEKMRAAMEEIYRRDGVKGNRVGLGALKTTSLFSFLMDRLFNKGTPLAEDVVASEMRGWNGGYYHNKDAYHYNVEVSGLFMRRVWAGGAPASNTSLGAADTFHVDQDIDGEPFRSILDGTLPGLHWLFKIGFLRLVNFWIPLHGPHVRPLAVMDQRLSSPRDFVKLRWYPQLKSDESKNFTSDLFTLRAPPREQQQQQQQQGEDEEEPRIFFNPYMKAMESGIIFSTTHAFHSGVAVGGDLTLSKLRVLLQSGECPIGWVFDEMAPLRRAVEVEGADLHGKMSAKVVEVARAAVDYVEKITCAGKPEDLKRKEEILNNMQRASLEMRIVTIVIPKTVFYGALSVASIAYLAYVSMRV